MVIFLKIMSVSGSLCDKLSISFLVSVTFINHESLHASGPSLLPIAKFVGPDCLRVPLLLLRGLPDASLVLEDPVNDFGVVVGNVEHL